MAVKQELKPCPFCGCEVVDHPNDERHAPLILHPVNNGYCPVAGRVFVREHWNHREAAEQAAFEQGDDHPEWLSSLQNILNGAEDEGDRYYFGSTNDVDELREVVAALTDASYPLRYFKRPDLHRKVAELQAAEQAAAERERVLVEALEHIMLNCQGASLCEGDPGGGHEANYFIASQALAKVETAK